MDAKQQGRPTLMHASGYRPAAKATAATRLHMDNGHGLLFSHGFDRDRVARTDVRDERQLLGD